MTSGVHPIPPICQWRSPLVQETFCKDLPLDAPQIQGAALRSLDALLGSRSGFLVGKIFSEGANPARQAAPLGPKADSGAVSQVSGAGQAFRGLLELFSLGIFSGSACARPQELKDAGATASTANEPPVERPLPPNPWNVVSDGIQKVRVDLNGDSALGSVLYVRNMHADPYLLEAEHRLQDMTPEMKPTIEYQLRVLNLLEQVKPEHLMGEKNYFDQPPGRVSSHLPALLRSNGDSPFEQFDRALKSFSSAAPPYAAPDRLQSILLYFLGGDELYKNLHRDAYVHHSVSEMTNRRVVQYVKGLVSGEQVKDRHLVFTLREAETTKALIAFLKENPGKKIVLVYGAAHNFCDDFQREGFTPQMISVWWETESFPKQAVPKACR